MKPPAKIDPKTVKLIAELIEAADNAVYWMLRRHASDVEEGICGPEPKPGFIVRLQAAVKAIKQPSGPPSI